MVKMGTEAHKNVYNFSEDCNGSVYNSSILRLLVLHTSVIKMPSPSLE
jgi:hypothetical protein